MNSQWYYALQNQQKGPVEEAEFDSLVASGLINDDTLVWREGMANWQPYRSVKPVTVATPGLTTAVGMPAPAAAAPNAGVGFCSECGAPHELSEMVRFGNTWVCANCKDVFAQRLREGGLRTGTMQYAGFWIRVVARIIDAILLSIVYLPFSAAMGALFIPAISRSGGLGGISEGVLGQLFGFQMILIGFQLIGNAAYEIFFVYKFGATPGKMAVGKKIVTAEGGRLSLGRSVGRHFANYLNTFTLGIGYIMVGLDEEKRGLHDRICDTRVVAK